MRLQLFLSRMLSVGSGRVGGSQGEEVSVGEYGWNLILN